MRPSSLIPYGTFLVLILTCCTGSAEIDPKQMCIPGTIPAIKTDTVRTLILCYVYGCPEEVTDMIAKNFNVLHHYDMHPEMLSGNETAPAVPASTTSAAAETTTAAPGADTPDTTTTTVAPSASITTPSKPAVEEPPIHILSKLAKLTSALEKDRVAALAVCTDWMSLMNKLLVDLLQIDVKCFLEPDPKYPPDFDDGAEIDCDEMTVYMKQLQKYFRGQCDSKGENCNEKLKTAVSWFGRAYKQLGRTCYYDAYDYLDK
ncbi:uncharacterized protein LOC129724836 [Wyeomyia smithii]|uniref:uncharacterized protein LOC129724836 n=1 Tax=Wyeomyia smithii TaxID=174621 RepID=UPI0024680DAB|nr:uncharacterized protein LOC129724836 [Wyeomyia smithii]